MHSDPDNKEQVPGGWITDVNPKVYFSFISLIKSKSLQIITGAMSDVGVLNVKAEDKFQFLRVGYFCVDKDTDLTIKLKL